MKCYLVRDGKADDTVRGGWSDAPLTDEGIAQVNQLSLRLTDAGIGQSYTSDFRRARQSAEILSHHLGISVVELPEFRETNNGLLAGMENGLAAK